MVNQDDEITILPPTYEKPNQVVQTLEMPDSISESLDERTEPSDDDLAQLRRISETIPLRAWSIRLSSYLIIGLLSLSSCANDSRFTDVKEFGEIILKTHITIPKLQGCLGWVLGEQLD